MEGIWQLGVVGHVGLNAKGVGDLGTVLSV